MTFREHMESAARAYLTALTAEKAPMKTLADKAGVHRVTLYELLERYGVERKSVPAVSPPAGHM